MAREIPYIAAVQEGIRVEMERDPTVVFYGQDVAPSDEDPLVQAFGRERVRVSPISETAEIGMAVGLALAGYRPVVELLMAEFMLVAMNQVVNEAPRLRYMSGGQVKVPAVFKAGYGFTAGWAGQHTGSIYGMFMGFPGLKIALPSTPADAKGLMAAAIRDDNPVVLPDQLPAGARARRRARGRVRGPVRRGRGSPRRRGRDDRRHRLDGRAGARGRGDARQRGHQAEVIDPRTLNPLDTATILSSVEKTGRLVIADQGTRHGGASAVIAAEVAEHGFGSLKAPIAQVTALDVTVPYSEPMEAYVLPNEEKIAGSVRQVLGEAPVAA